MQESDNGANPTQLEFENMLPRSSGKKKRRAERRRRAYYKRARIFPTLREIEQDRVNWGGLEIIGKINRWRKEGKNVDWINEQIKAELAAGRDVGESLELEAQEAPNEDSENRSADPSDLL